MQLQMIIRAGSIVIVLPGVHIAEGGAFGAMSLINKSTKEWTVYIGAPVKEWKERKELSDMEDKFRMSESIGK